MKNFGLCLVIAGAIWGIIAFSMETTLETGSGNVHNFSLADQRRNHIVGAGIIFISGVLLFGFGSIKPTEKVPLPLKSTALENTGDFAASFSNATTIWKDNLGDLVLLTLVFCLVAWIPIANIGFITGYTRSLLKVFRGQGKAGVGDLFNAWDCFGNLFVYLVLYLVAVLLLSFIPFLGTVAVLALYFVAAPGMLAVIDKNLGAVDAFKWSLATIQKDAFNWLLAVLVGGVLGSAGAIALGIGIIITIPWGQLVLISQYDARKAD